MKNSLLFLLCVFLTHCACAQKDTNANKPVFTIVQQMPKFEGGLENYLKTHLVYPREQKEAGISGKVFVNFIVEPDGSVSTVKVLKGCPGQPEFDAEAVRVFATMPKWTPGYQNNKAVRVSYNFAVQFNIDNAGMQTAPVSANDSSIHYHADVAPAFIGDFAMYQNSHLQYPPAAIERKKEGTVYGTFTVSKTGKILHPAILRGVDSSLDKEVLEFISNMPDWLPGKISNVPVAVQVTLPVHFSIATKSIDVGDKPNTIPPQQDMPIQSPPVPAETENRCTNTRFGLWVEPNAGIGTSKISFSNGVNTITNGPAQGLPSKSSGGFGFSAGANLCFMLSENIGIVSGIQIQQYVCHYSLADTYPFPDGATPPTTTSTSGADTTTVIDHSFSINYSFSYLQIPVLFRYTGGDACSLGIYVQGGLLLGFLQSATETGTVSQVTDSWTKQGTGIATFYQYKSSATTSQNVTAKPNASSSDLGITLGAGARIAISQRFSFLAGISANFKLNSAGDGTKDIINFGNNQYSYYGTGNYGGGFSLLLNAGFLIHLTY